LSAGYLSEKLRHGFTLLRWRSGSDAGGVDGLPIIDVQDSDKFLIERFALTPGAAYLIRPDRHVAARFHHVTHAAVAAALSKASAGWRG
jgi:3-(3-hydroxy-phenyl)propionate hydroxylase